MAQIQRIKIPRTPDQAVIDCFYELAEKYKIASITVNAAAFSNIGQVNIEGEPNEDLNALLKHQSTLIESSTLVIPGINITYHRGGQVPPEERSPIYDEILLNVNPQNGDISNPEKFNIVATINNKLCAFEPGRFVETGLSQEQNQLLSIHTSTLERLEILNEGLVKQSSEFRNNLEKRFEEKVTELEQQTRDKEEKLDNIQEERSKVLANREQAVAEKLSAIDDRDNTHVRREIRDKMLSDVKERIEQFGVSENTEKKRTPVLIGMIFMVVAIISMLSYTVYELNTASENIPGLYWLWVKIAFLSIALLGSILFYIKWQNRWAEQYANSEFQLQQFYIDVNRANWVIESCLEWRKETDSAIPTALLESIARNLFNTSSEDLEKVVHPSDELASALLGSASKLKMKLGDNELEFDKPGKIKSKPPSSG